ncbi:hypothetical protein AB0I28_19705 [Phytomonospora sp. NPDC050363]|uniref:hypothetical protein n=1 Tax=Phytomonospora sp. NPDC050363 TaxID=3155642 RepID=UPI003402A144
MSSSDDLSRTEYMVLRAFVFRMWQQPVTLIRFENLPEVMTERLSVQDVEQALPQLADYLFTEPVAGDAIIRVLKVADTAEQPVVAREPENWPPVSGTKDSQRLLLRRIDELLDRTGFPVEPDDLATPESFARSRTEVELMRLKRDQMIRGDSEAFGPVSYPRRILAVTGRGKRWLQD